jgi:hypothetical protein
MECVTDVIESDELSDEERFYQLKLLTILSKLPIEKLKEIRERMKKLPPELRVITGVSEISGDKKARGRPSAGVGRNTMQKVSQSDPMVIRLSNLSPKKRLDLKRQILWTFLQAERKATGKKLQPQKHVKLLPDPSRLR